MIHPTAIIHPKAQVHPSVEVGAYAIIDEFVKIGAGCKVEHHVCLQGHTTIGEGNSFGVGSVIGGAPQDLKYQGAPTRLFIGNGNVFREMVTVHCSNKMEEDTTIGDECFLMANSHVGHNAHVGSHVILANAALIAGHVQVEDRAFISGNTAIHQFVRIGELAMIQGVSAMSCDVPPFTIAFDKNLIAGLNIIGLRRAGFAPEERVEMKRAYNLLFRTQLKRQEAIAQAEKLFHFPGSRKMIEFVKAAKRGVASDVGLARKTARTNRENELPTPLI